MERRLRQIEGTIPRLFRTDCAEFLPFQRCFDELSDGFPIFLFQVPEFDCHMDSWLGAHNYTCTLNVATGRERREVEAIDDLFL